MSGSFWGGPLTPIMLGYAQADVELTLQLQAKGRTVRQRPRIEFAGQPDGRPFYYALDCYGIGEVPGIDSQIVDGIRVYRVTAEKAAHLKPYPPMGHMPVELVEKREVVDLRPTIVFSTRSGAGKTW